MQKVQYEAGTSAFETIIKTLIDGLDNAQGVIALHRADGTPFRVILPEQVEETKLTLQAKIDNHAPCCIECALMKDYRSVLEQLKTPQISVSVCSGTAIHFLSISKKDKVKQEFEEYLQWKSTRSSVKTEPVVCAQLPE